LCESKNIVRDSYGGGPANRRTGTLVERVLPVVAEMESWKGKILLNGHFKYLPGFDV
jgi:hypothetical protein